METTSIHGRYKTRWALAGDLPQIRGIAENNGLPAGNLHVFGNEKYARNGLVVCSRKTDKVYAYILSRVRHTDNLKSKPSVITSMAVEPSLHRHGLGRLLIEREKEWLSNFVVGFIDRMIVFVDERNLGAQLFFREVGFHGRLIGYERIKFTWKR